MILKPRFRQGMVAGVLIACAARLWAGPQIVPILRMEALGGQFFFEGAQTSFSGNASWLVAPGVKFSDRFSLIPTVSGSYQRVREVKELIGGGFLTREEFENSAALKGVYKFGTHWQGKLKASYKNDWLVESEDEKLGKGLFDNTLYSAGAEMEFNGETVRSFRFGVTPYLLRFPRYSSLSSGSEFGSEIQSGDRTLDYLAYDGNAAIEILLTPKTLTTFSALHSYRVYEDQKTVTSSGQYTNQNRKDHYGQVSAGLSRMLPSWNALKLQSMAGLESSLSYLRSDQNNYDATFTRFNDDYYDYTEVRVAPRLAGRFYKKLDAAVTYDYTYRTYRRRVVQDADGTYGSDRIHLNTHTLSCNFRYPLGRGFSALAQGVYRTATSNMKYERTYRYTYSAQHYFMGLGWDF